MRFVKDSTMKIIIKNIYVNLFKFIEKLNNDIFNIKNEIYFDNKQNNKIYLIYKKIQFITFFFEDLNYEDIKDLESIEVPIKKIIKFFLIFYYYHGLIHILLKVYLLK